MDKSKKLGIAVILASAFLLSGCFRGNPEDINAWVKPYEANVTAENYIVQPPDELEIHCTQVPEVHLQRERVRPDGKISFEVLGEVEVAGKTPGEISVAIGQRVKELYTLPGDHAVDVRITVYASHAYYVVGQVLRPGPKGYTGRDSVLTAVATAGPNPLAWERRVRVIRPSGQEGTEPLAFEVDYIKMIERGDTTKDVLLNDGDIIYVPPTILASFGLVLEEFITPVARGFYGWYLLSNPPTQTDRGYSPLGGFR